MFALQDFCNGSYTGYCDVSRQFDPDPSPNVSSTGIPLEDYSGNVTGTAVLTQYERFDLLDYMNLSVRCASLGGESSDGKALTDTG